MKININILTTIFLLLSFIQAVNGQPSKSLTDKENYAEVANAHFMDNELDEAKKILDEGIKKYPKDSDLRMLLGRYYFEKNNYDLARYELLEALDYNKDNNSAKQILVNVEMASGRYSSAICYINELLEVNPYWKGLWMKKMEAYRLQGNIVEASRIMERLSHIYPEDTEIRSAYLYSMEELATQRSRSGELDEAISLTSTLIEKDPMNEDFYIEIINIYLRSGNPEKALMYTERGLINLPHSLALINKKADILGDAYKYNEALIFLQSKIGEIGEPEHKNILTRRYNAFMEDAARFHRKSDPYALYKTIYERNPRNEEAFSYVMGAAISNAYYDDALEILKIAKESMGETKDLLVKEQNIYRLMGAQSRADQTTIKLYQLYPEDYDIRYQYTQYRLQQAKTYMQEGMYEKALSNWIFVAQNGEDGDVSAALISIYNCNFQLRKFDEAIIVLEQIIIENPDEPEWRAKKAVVYGEQKKYKESLREYESVIAASNPQKMESALEGYDELATGYVKKLMEDYLYIEAREITDHWLEVNPGSEMGVRYATNLSMLMKDYDSVEQYASIGRDKKNTDIYPLIKVAEARNKRKQHEGSLEILSGEIANNPYHQELIGAYSQSSYDYAQRLIKDSEYARSMEVIDKALVYDPDNKDLKHLKGITYEKLHKADSALYYQSFYDPNLMDFTDFSKHLKYLEYNNYKNEVSFYYLRGRSGDDQATSSTSSVATFEYTRFGKNNIYAGRVNYAGRPNGKGIQGQAEWTHDWNPKFYTQINGAFANKFFASFMGNASLFKKYNHEWESELGGGYRRSADHNNIYSINAGVSKTWHPWWLNARYNSFFIRGKYYYNIFAQGRIFLNNTKSYISAMGSFGSAPDVDVVNYELYNGFSVTNSMVGIGVHYLIGGRFTAGILGNWYNYEDNSPTLGTKEGKYRNLYTLYFQLHVRF